MSNMMRSKTARDDYSAEKEQFSKKIHKNFV